MTEHVASLVELATMAAAKLDETMRSRVLVPVEVAELVRAAQVRLDLSAVVEAASEYYAEVYDLQQIHSALLGRADLEDPGICTDLLVRYEHLTAKQHRLVEELRLAWSAAVELEDDRGWREYLIQHLATALEAVTQLEDVLGRAMASLREMALVRP